MPPPYLPTHSPTFKLHTSTHTHPTCSEIPWGYIMSGFIHQATGASVNISLTTHKIGSNHYLHGGGGGRESGGDIHDFFKHEGGIHYVLSKYWQKYISFSTVGGTHESFLCSRRRRGDQKVLQRMINPLFPPLAYGIYSDHSHSKISWSYSMSDLCIRSHYPPTNLPSALYSCPPMF